MDKKNIQAAIEAILFTMGESVEDEKIAKAVGADLKTTRKHISELMKRYDEEDRGIKIIKLENSYQMCTKKEMYEYLIRIVSQPKKQVLTDVLLETLSIIAYKQPVTKSEMEKSNKRNKNKKNSKNSSRNSSKKNSKGNSKKSKSKKSNSRKRRNN